MTEQQQLKRDSGREMAVYKRDDMIQKGRHQLSLREQRCVLFAISKIKPTDSIFEEYTFDIKDMYRICGLADESYTELKEILTGLKQKTWWVETAPDVESTVSWFNKVRSNKRSGKVTIRFDDDMMPFLLQLTEKDEFYTGYSLRYVLPMSSQYSPRLYELLKSYQKNNRKWFFEIDDLKKLLDAENYVRFPDFRRFVIEPAVEEINKYTDIEIGWDVVRSGRGGKVTRVEFFLAAKGKEALLEAKQAGNEVLDGQIDLDEILAQTSTEESAEARFFREQREKGNKV